MTKSLFTNFVDKTLLFIVSGFLAIAVAAFFVRDLATIIVVGVTIGLSVTALVSIYQAKKISPCGAKQIKECMMQFYLNKDDFSLQTVLNALKVRYKNAAIDGDYILIDKVAVFAYLKPKALSVDGFCDIYKNAPKNINRIVVLTANGISNDAKNFVASINLKPYAFVSKPSQTYMFLKHLHALPMLEYKLKSNRRTIKLFFAEALSPPAARRYLMTAILLIGSSFFMPASIYFLVVGSLCVLLSVLAALDLGGKIIK